MVKQVITKFSHYEITPIGKYPVYVIAEDEKKKKIDQLLKTSKLEIIKSYCFDNGYKVSGSVVNLANRIYELEGPDSKIFNLAEKNLNYEPINYKKINEELTEEEKKVLLSLNDRILGVLGHNTPNSSYHVQFGHFDSTLFRKLFDVNNWCYRRIKKLFQGKFKSFPIYKKIFYNNDLNFLQVIFFF